MSGSRKSPLPQNTEKRLRGKIARSTSMMFTGTKAFSASTVMGMRSGGNTSTDSVPSTTSRPAESTRYFRPDRYTRAEALFLAQLGGADPQREEHEGEQDVAADPDEQARERIQEPLRLLRDENAGDDAEQRADEQLDPDLHGPPGGQSSPIAPIRQFGRGPDLAERPLSRIHSRP